MLACGYGLHAAGVFSDGVSAASLGQPAVLGALGALIGPVVFFYVVAALMRRTQDMRLTTRAMAEIAVRLAEPETIATEQVVNLSHAIRREVASMGDGIERALARAGELENLVRNEVASLERSYTDNERRMRSMIDELVNEREAVVTNADRMRGAMSGAHETLARDLTAVTERLSSSVTDAGLHVTDTLGLRGRDITDSMADAGEATAALIGQHGAEIAGRLSGTTQDVANRLAATTQIVSQEIAEQVARVDERLRQTGDDLASKLLGTRRRCRGALRTDRVPDRIRCRGPRPGPAGPAVGHPGHAARYRFGPSRGPRCRTRGHGRAYRRTDWTSGRLWCPTVSRAPATTWVASSISGGRNSNSAGQQLASLFHDRTAAAQAAFDGAQAELTAIFETRLDDLSGFGKGLVRAIDERAGAARTAFTASSAKIELMFAEREAQLGDLTERVADTMLARTGEARTAFEAAGLQMEQLLATHDAEFAAGRQQMADLLGDHVSVTRAALDASNDNLERLFAEREAQLSSAGDRLATLVDDRTADMRHHIDHSAASLGEAFEGHRSELAGTGERFTVLLDNHLAGTRDAVDVGERRDRPRLLRRSHANDGAFRGLRRPVGRQARRHQRCPGPDGPCVRRPQSRFRGGLRSSDGSARHACRRDPRRRR